MEVTTMKRKKMNFIFQLAIVSILTLGLSLAASADTLKNIKKRGYIRIAVANEIPYGYVTSSGKAKGFGPDVARAVLKRMGIDDIQWTVTEFGSDPGTESQPGRYRCSGAKHSPPALPAVQLLRAQHQLW